MDQLTFKPDDKILVIAPHPDDEMIGCGGLICKYGSQIDVLVVTDGGLGYSDDYPKDKIVDIRKEETTNVFKIIPVHELFHLDIPDQQTAKYKDKIMEIDLTGYDYVFVPNRFEGHPDHAIIYPLVKEMKSRQRGNFVIFEYEVWTPLREFNYYLDIADVIDRKLESVSQYKSQTSIYDYVAMTKGINSYRGILYKTPYAEVYLHMPERSFMEKVKSRAGRLAGRFRHPQGF